MPLQQILFPARPYETRLVQKLGHRTDVLDFKDLRVLHRFWNRALKDLRAIMRRVGGGRTF